MNLHVSLLESIWVALNLSTLILTLSALVDALADRVAIRLLNGHAREIAADGIVRRESFRVVVQTLLLLAVLPGALVPGEPVLNLTILALMAVPVVLLTSSILDARERKLTTIMVAADILAENVTAMARVEAAIAENTGISQGARDDAREAATAANAVNSKIAAQGAAIIDQGKVQVISSEAVQRMEATVGHTSDQVEEIHHATVRDDVT